MRRAGAVVDGQDSRLFSEKPQVTAPNLPRVIRTSRTALALAAALEVRTDERKIEAVDIKAKELEAEEVKEIP